MITIINTGGTFNKKYNKVSGKLEIPKNSKSVKKILSKSFYNNLEFDIKGIIFKDSLDFTKKDREKLLLKIKNSKNSKIVVIHGTDTMDKSIALLKKELDSLKSKTIIFTGAMKPFEIEKIEATSNLTLAIAYLTFKKLKSGIYIAMNGLFDCESKIEKDRVNGKFIFKNLR